jgi:hypothetical protein
MLHACGGMRTPDRGSTTGDSQLDRLSAAKGCPHKTPGAFLNNACVGPEGRGPWMGRVTASEASQSPVLYAAQCGLSPSP